MASLVYREGKKRDIGGKRGGDGSLEDELPPLDVLDFMDGGGVGRQADVDPLEEKKSAVADRDAVGVGSGSTCWGCGVDASTVMLSDVDRVGRGRGGGGGGAGVGPADLKGEAKKAAVLLPLAGAICLSEPDASSGEGSGEGSAYEPFADVAPVEGEVEIVSLGELEPEWGGERRSCGIGVGRRDQASMSGS